MGIFLIVFGTILLLGSFGFFLYFITKYLKKRADHDNFKITMLIFGAISLIFGLGALLINYGYLVYFNVANATLGMILPGALLFFSIALFTICLFVLYYYKKDFNLNIHKLLGIFLVVGYVLSGITFFVWFDGGASTFVYPLVSGFAIDGSGFHWMTSSNFTQYSGSFRIMFYALFILSGALFVYFLCDHKLYQRYGEHGLLSSTFFVAFPAGILGSRIWYVVGNWNGDGQGGPNFSQNPLSMFNFSDGGLTIIGGAVFGIIAGVLWVYFRKRDKFTILDAVDFIVPTILIAQVIGRWGNFFNHEVYGATIFTSSEVWWLPSFIKNQMDVTLDSISSGVHVDGLSGKFHSPLFLFEGMLNLAGYFLIIYGCKGINSLAKFIKKKKAISNGISVSEFESSYTQNFIAPGAQGCLYLVVYGAVRAPLELLRDPKYNMGSDGTWSVINSLIMIFLGVFLIILCFIYRKYKPALIKKFGSKKNKTHNIINDKQTDSLNDLNNDVSSEIKTNEKLSTNSNNSNRLLKKDINENHNPKHKSEHKKEKYNSDDYIDE